MFHDFFEKISIAWEFALARNWRKEHPLASVDMDRWTVGEMVLPKSTFRQELLAQFGRAAQAGRIEVLINSADLCRAIGGGPESGSCDAMQAEYKPGDKILLGRSNDADMTVRYMLPRTN